MTAPTCYTVRAACEKLSVSEATMFRLLKSGQIALDRDRSRCILGAWKRRSNR
jgi:hypothetical protein